MQDEEPDPGLYTDPSDLEIRDIVGGDVEFHERKPEKKKKTITRTDIIYNELIAEPLMGRVQPVSFTNHRFALCEYGAVMPIILVTIGNFFYLIGYLYERFFFDLRSTSYYVVLFEGWIVIMLFCSLTLGIKACQVGLNAYCCRRR